MAEKADKVKGMSSEGLTLIGDRQWKCWRFLLLLVGYRDGLGVFCEYIFSSCRFIVGLYITLSLTL